MEERDGRKSLFLLPPFSFSLFARVEQRKQASRLRQALHDCDNHVATSPSHLLRLSRSVYDVKISASPHYQKRKRT